MTTDITEKGLETIIIRHMTGSDGINSNPGTIEVRPDPEGAGYFAGIPKDYDRQHCVDVTQLFSFLQSTQPEEFKKLGIVNGNDPKDVNRLKFLARTASEINKRGVIDVLRNGVQHGPTNLNLFFVTPSPGNERAAALNTQNRFSITRQLAYSNDETRRALDL